MIDGQHLIFLLVINGVSLFGYGIASWITRREPMPRNLIVSKRYIGAGLVLSVLSVFFPPDADASYAYTVVSNFMLIGTFMASGIVGGLSAAAEVHQRVWGAEDAGKGSA